MAMPSRLLSRAQVRSWALVQVRESFPRNRLQELKMRNRMSPYWTGIVALVLLPSLSAGQARGQRGGRGAASPAPSAPAPHWADGRVNLDAAPGQKGFWNVMQGNVVG